MKAPLKRRRQVPVGIYRRDLIDEKQEYDTFLYSFRKEIEEKMDGDLMDYFTIPAGELLFGIYLQSLKNPPDDDCIMLPSNDWGASRIRVLREIEADKKRPVKKTIPAVPIQNPTPNLEHNPIPEPEPELDLVALDEAKKKAINKIYTQLMSLKKGWSFCVNKNRYSVLAINDRMICVVIIAGPGKGISATHNIKFFAEWIFYQ